MKEKEKFSPKQWVLVRDYNDEYWTLDIYSHYSKKNETFVTVGGGFWEQCIPYEGNEKLLDTKDSPNEKSKFKDGDFLASKGSNFLFILDGNGPCKTSMHCCWGSGMGFRIGGAANSDYIDGYRMATDKEKDFLLSVMHSNRVDWDEKKKELVTYECGYLPKCGDFVAFGREIDKPYIGIFKELAAETSAAHVDYVNYISGSISISSVGWISYNMRPATEEEKNMLLSKLHEIGKDWNAEEKKIVDYKEPYVPKDGDFVHNDGDFYESVFIMRGTIHNNAFLTNGGMSRKQGDTNREWEVMPYKRLTFRGWNPRPATEDEKKELLRILGEMGKIWDEDEKEIKDIEWKPAEGEIFYYVEFSPCDFAFFADFRTFHSDDEQCKGHIEKGNYYRTIREAEYEANQLNEKNNMIFEK